MPARTISNFFHCTADNVGDRMCGPGQYFWTDTCEELPLGVTPKHPLKAAIIGGGQIFEQLSPTLRTIREQSPNAAIVAWGVGLPPKGRRDGIVQQTVKDFAAFGTRNFEWRDDIDFVPCASCLSPLLDEVPSAQHPVVAYIHRKKEGPQNIPNEIPVMTNAMRSPREVINFIASGETVITSSYHGVYWAQLLGRKVLCLPYNNKFQTFQHAPMMSEPSSWYRDLALASHTEPLLEEYRALNLAFATRVMDICNAR